MIIKNCTDKSSKYRQLLVTFIEKILIVRLEVEFLFVNDSVLSKDRINRSNTEDAEVDISWANDSCRVLVGEGSSFVYGVGNFFDFVLLAIEYLN